jgi:DNA-binding response OmpR family regulator
MRILLVDDSPELLEITRLMLEKFGYAVSTARTSAEAEDVCRRQPVDAAIIDYGLGRDNGALLARSLKAEHQSLKVILTSGTDIIPDDEMALADAYYMKGYARPTDLQELLKKLLGGRDDRLAG